MWRAAGRASTVEGERVTWFRQDDGASSHPKFLVLSQDADLLWHKAGPSCAAVNSDGLVNPDLLPHYGALAKVYDPAAVKAAVKELVKVVLWHDSKTIKSCGRCMERTDGQGVPRGWFYFHDWRDYQPSKAGKYDTVERKRERRKRHLHTTEPGQRVKGLVRERDQDMCRYCGIVTHWTNDHTSATAGSIDHLDPFDFETDGSGNYVDGCVVACKTCNGRKRDQTPEQAGMPLLPVPEPIRIGSKADRDRVASGSGPGPEQRAPSRSTRDGPGLAQNGSAIGSGIGSRSGSVNGSGRVPAPVIDPEGF